ncbi:hypothetical protein [Pedobacter ginsengiterrae]|uniref:glycosyl-4,4'-diaponeurosporenoate acyltransferase CrtO family protein n=1 Tax=Pedobacter ginsengiterrae TaxID=871696 RepID=UPI0031E1EAEA
MKMINSLINIFWTIIGFLPVIYFWYTQLNTVALVIGLGISLVLATLPIRFFQIGLSRQNLEKMGVHLVGYMVQDGKFINRLARNKGINNKFVYLTKRESFNRRSVIYERYHLCCFFFFLISLLLALFAQRFILSACLLIANILYNILPVLLQQYYRSRVQNIIKSRPGNQWD